jgi:L-fuconolactonase
VIDAHQHFWKIGAHDCTWPTADLPLIYRDFVPADLAPLAQAAGVTGTVLVQSQESDADTDFLLRLASESSLIKAVVGWVDLASPTAATRISRLAQHPKMRGLRPMLQSLPQDNWILSPDLELAIAEMKLANLSLDALVRVRHLPFLRIFAKRHPNLPIVIDHAAKPAIAHGSPKGERGEKYEKGEFDTWLASMAALAELPQVYCKISGLLTEATAEQGLDELRPYITQLYHLFGAERLMWGSDWPVLNLAPNSQYAAYGDWLAMAKLLLPVAGASELDLIFEQTARKFYRF